jgi:phosphopentomutase
VPVFVTGERVRSGVDLGVRSTFADLGQTVAEVFGVGPLRHGRSFLGEILLPATAAEEDKQEIRRQGGESA